MQGFEAANENERRAYQRAAPLDTGEWSMDKPMERKFYPGEQVRIKVGDHAGKVGVVARAYHEQNGVRPYMVDHDDIPLGTSYWGPYRGDELEKP